MKRELSPTGSLAPPQAVATTASNEHAMTRRNIALQGTSDAPLHQRREMRRRLLAMSATLALVLAACGDASTSSGVISDETVSSDMTLSETAVAPETTSTLPVATTTIATPTTTTPSASTTTLPAVTTTLGAAVSTIDVTTTTLVTTTLAPTTTVRSVGPPRLSVSQTTGLDPAGVRVTVRGTGYDVTKGVYVIVCNQAAWTDARRCVGGVNIDGSSPVSEWVSTNPPAYAKGLTVPFANDGSFSVTLLTRAIGDAIDCTKEQCGVVTFADHTRRDDRSQDVFVPITFKPGS